MYFSHHNAVTGSRDCKCSFSHLMLQIADLKVVASLNSNCKLTSRLRKLLFGISPILNGQMLASHMCFYLSPSASREAKNRMSSRD